MNEVFVGQRHQRIADRGVAVRMVAHALAHHVGDLVELAVVHFEERVQDAPLHGLEPVVDVRDRAVLDDIGGVFEIVAFVEVFYRAPSDQVLHDILPALGGIFPHVKFERLAESP